MKHLISALALVLSTGAAAAECASGPGSTGHWVYTRHNASHTRCWFRTDVEREWIPADRESDLEAQLEEARPVHEARNVLKDRPRPGIATVKRHKRPSRHNIKTDPLPVHGKERPIEVAHIAPPQPPMLLAEAFPDTVHINVIDPSFEAERGARERLIMAGEKHLASDSRPLPDLRPILRAETVAIAQPAGTDGFTKVWVGAGLAGVLALLAGCFSKLKRRPRVKINWDAKEGWNFPFIGEKLNLSPPVAVMPGPLHPPSDVLSPSPRAPALRLVVG